MAKRVGGAVLRVVRSVASDTTDRELLDRYVAGDQAAFAALVRRHAGMILGVTRRVLPTVQDAEDACQATFLVLAQQAATTRWQASIANWLYTTARRIAGQATRARRRRTAREVRPGRPTPSSLDEVTAREWLAALDEELDRLSPHYREVLVLCHLEGLARDEAAARLGVPLATVKIRLERGRKRLANALSKRGVVLGAALLAASVPSPAGASPSCFLESILAAVGAGGSPSPVVALLAQGVAMNAWTKPMTVGAALAAVVMLTVGLAGMAPQPTAQADDKPTMEEEKMPDAKNKPDESQENVTIRVVDPDGKPVAGATVYRQRHSFPDASSVAEVTAGKTDADGKLVTERVLFASFHATAEGYCAGQGGDPVGDMVTLRLVKPLPLKGRLVDLQGKPVPNANVIVERVSAAANDDLTAAYNAYRVNPESTWGAFSSQLDGRATGAPKGTATDKEGRFELSGVGKLRVIHLRFEAEGIEAARATVFADPQFAERMKPPTDAEKNNSGMTGGYRAAVHGPEFTHAARPEHVITGTITDAVTGKPVKGAKVAGTTTRIGIAFVGNPWHDKVEATTGADGKYRLPGLVKAKTRYLHVKGGDTAPYLDHIVEVADTAGYTPAVADVKLLPAVEVRGQLVNKATGKPVAGSAQWLPLTTNERLLKRESNDAQLYTSSLGDNWPSGSRAVAGADGRFILRVPAGPGVVLARSDLFDRSAVFAPLRVREDDRKHLRKNEKPPGTIEVGPRARDSEEFFDTIMLITPLRWENGYAVVNPDTKAKTVDAKIEFDPGATVTLAATDLDGKPLGGVTLVGPGNYGRNPPAFAKPEIAVGGIDPKGRPVQFYLLHKERKLCAAVTVTGDEKGPVAVKLRPCGSVTGRVVDHTGKAVTGARVTFQMTDSVADELLRQKLYRGVAEVATDTDGEFTFPRMFPDVEFDLHVILPGLRYGAAESKRVKLKPGEARDAGEFKTRDPKQIDDE